ncbi:MAG TPA: flagellar hook capping FlgD N-terminal domain-containing protein [Stellaceae bacterium]|nr:flagellar hook capping FlgD N-terminal domain-containing protein [Stellaceae bacterium]
MTTTTNLSSLLPGAAGSGTGGSGTAGAASATAAASSAGSAAASSASATFGNNFNTFLTLLTTQLQNQDPLSPMDTNQFTQQLVEFSQVEQQINTNNNLTNLITLQNQADLMSAQSLVGQTGEFTAAKAPLVNGAANFSYTLPSTAANTTLAIANAQGSIVWAGSGQTAAGTYNFTWNGEDMNGASQPAGVYTLQINATGADGSTITPTIAAFAPIDQVSTQNGTTTFSSGGQSYPISQLIGVQKSSS